jgi:hypothetical protein
MSTAFGGAEVLPYFFADRGYDNATMAELNETRDLQCPYHLAQGYLFQSLSGRAASGEATTLTLSVPLPGVALRKDVAVTFGKGTDPMHFDQPWSVRWTPVGGGPYPDFDGELTVRAGEDYTAAVLELKGTYRPPGGVAGAAFDAVAGGRIAAATAQHLLEDVGNEMEARYRREEAEKRSRV